MQTLFEDEMLLAWDHPDRLDQSLAVRLDRKVLQPFARYGGICHKNPSRTQRESSLNYLCSAHALQARSYLLGYDEILALRREAEARLGPRFDLRAFHDAVLCGGSVTLPVLRDRVHAWLARSDALR